MARLAPGVAAVRVAVRRCLQAGRPEPGAGVLVACSGGPDSVALAAAAGFVAPRLGLRAGLVTVDHRLQPGSAERAGLVADWARREGFAPVVVAGVEVAGRPGGPEAAARHARYEALVAVARNVDAAAVLLGHTRDDQAETVLLALARGAGPRGLAGMPSRRVVDGVAFLRPLLDVSRADAHAAAALGTFEPWHDPHNSDRRYARSRVRALLPAVIEALGPAVVDNLARTAKLVAADTAALDTMASAARVSVAGSGGAGSGGAGDGGERRGGLSVPALAGLPAALRTRVLHGWARDLGVSGSALSARHVAALDALITDWHGQGPVALPGGVQVARRSGRLVDRKGR